MFSPKSVLIWFVERNILDQNKIPEILQQSEETNLTVDLFLVQKSYIAEKQMLEVFAKEMEYEYREKLTNIQVPESFCQRVNINFARTNSLIAVGEYNGRYQIATCSPLDTHPIDELSGILGVELDIVLAPRSEIAALINNAYQKNIGLDGPDEDENDDLDDITEDVEDLLDGTNRPFIIRTVNNILLQALKQRVSDIHMQPYEEKLQIRYRIDGILYDVQSIPKRYQDALITRVKVMGKMDIAEKRLPQDGRKSLKMGDANVDIRISSVPTSGGERIVMRILDKSARVYKLSEIGLDKKDLKLVDHFIHYSHGIILVTGPTGSGKSTTLYSSLTRLNSLEKNIMTIEDPVEYQLRGISQIQVSEKKGLTFAAGLRTLLRQDPDIIMVGEIRDQETARISIQAALTGHLVLSTLHTNDSASAVTRLLDIGIEPYLVSSSLLCVIAQRLMRQICSSCKTEYTPNMAKVKSIGLSPSDISPQNILWKGEGCENCMGTGYKDRCGIYEILPVTERVREQIVQRSSASIIKQGSVERGLRTLRMDAAKKVLDGITTIEEVLRVTQMDIA